MSIRDVEKNAARQIESLRRRQGREVAQLEDGHKTLKGDIKKTHEMEIVEIQQDNHRKVDGESMKKEKVLNQMKNHLDETKKLTDREIKELKDYSAKVKLEEHQKLSVHREMQNTENELSLDELNYRFNKEQKRVNAVGSEQLETLNRTRGTEISEKEAFYQDRLNTKTNKFNEKFSREDQMQKQLQDSQEKIFKSERVTTNLRQQQDMTKLSTAHEDFLQVRDDNFRKGLKDQDLMFEKKYADTMKKNNEEFTKLQALNAKVMTKMKTDLSEKLKTSVDRSDDTFYSFTQLSPKLKTFADRVEISVPVPDHAKADIQLTTNGKEAILNFNRRYDDAQKLDGVLSQLHKVESFTTRLQTDHHLDSKSVKSVYEDGVMTYTIKRA